jgi:predicted secreted Zn-dependent protease
MTRFNPATLGQVSWHVARRCNGGECVRIAASGDMVLIGDSKDPDGPVLAYSRAEWQTFVEGIRQGDFDNLA